MNHLKFCRHQVIQYCRLWKPMLQSRWSEYGSIWCAYPTPNSPSVLPRHSRMSFGRVEEQRSIPRQDSGLCIPQKCSFPGWKTIFKLLIDMDLVWLLTNWHGDSGNSILEEGMQSESFLCAETSRKTLKPRSKILFLFWSTIVDAGSLHVVQHIISRAYIHLEAICSRWRKRHQTYQEKHIGAPPFL
jgi:hypothetical protein